MFGVRFGTLVVRYASNSHFDNISTTDQDIYGKGHYMANIIEFYNILLFMLIVTLFGSLLCLLKHGVRWLPYQGAIDVCFNCD